MREVPDRLISFLKEEEQLRVKAYDDKRPNAKTTDVSQVKGVPTIGYGHTKGVTKQDIVDGRTCTPTEAVAWLREDLEVAQRRLLGVLDQKTIDGLTEGQYAALLSFVYNAGANSTWTVWKKIKAGRLDEVPTQLQRFVYSGGEKMAGLIKRRANEVILWHSDDGIVSVKATPPSSVIRETETPPETAEVKPLVKSNTVWTGAATAVAGVSMAAGQVAETVRPAAADSELLQRALSALAIFVVVCGVLVMVLKWIEHREKSK